MAAPQVGTSRGPSRSVSSWRAPRGNSPGPRPSLEVGSNHRPSAHEAAALQLSYPARRGECGDRTRAPERGVLLSKQLHYRSANSPCSACGALRTVELRAGVEPATSRLRNERSGHLSYRSVVERTRIELAARCLQGSIAPLEHASPGARRRTSSLPHQDSNLDRPVNSRVLCRLSYEGMVRGRGIEPRDLLLSARELRPAAFATAVVQKDECPPRESNPEPPDPESDASASWARRAWRREDESNACPIPGTPGFRSRCPTARASLSRWALKRPAVQTGFEPAISSSTVRRALLAALQDHAPPAGAEGVERMTGIEPAASWVETRRPAFRTSSACCPSTPQLAATPTGGRVTPPRATSRRTRSRRARSGRSPRRTGRRRRAGERPRARAPPGSRPGSR